MNSKEKLKKRFDPSKEDLILKIAETKSYMTVVTSGLGEKTY